MNTIYLVVGAPRSGTSALAWALRDQNIRMFVGADAPDLDSPTGNQEDNLARLINNRLMGRNSIGRWHDWDNPKYKMGASVEDVQLIQAYIRLRQNEANCSWGLKDPRLSFVIEPWYEATREMPVQWIHIYRENRHAVIASLVKMLPAPLRHCGDSTALHFLASNWVESYELACALAFERTGLHPFVLNYEELLTSQGQERLADQLGFTAPIIHVDPRFNRRGRSALPHRHQTMES
jgi:hypothetical protein